MTSEGARQASAASTPEPHAEHPPEGNSHHQIWTWFRHESRKVLVIALFFFGTFTLLQLTKAAVLQKFDLHTINPARALIGALIVAKVLLVADAIPFIRRFDAHPIAYAAFLRAWIFVLLTLAFECVESLFRHRHLGLKQASLAFLEECSSPVFWMLHVWLLILMFLFAAGRDLVRIVGRDKTHELLWGKRK